MLELKVLLKDDINSNGNYLIKKKKNKWIKLYYTLRLITILPEL